MWVAPPLQHLNVNGTLNELAIPNLSRDLLDEVIATLLMACVARVYPHVLTGSFAPNLRFLLYGVVAFKQIEDPKTVAIGYEGIDHVGYPADTVLTVKPEPIYLFPHELVECDLGKDEVGIRFYDKKSGVVVDDLSMDSTGRFAVNPAEAYGLSRDDLKALEDLNSAVDAAVEDAINAMAKSIQEHLLITTGDLAGNHFAGARSHRKIKKAVIRYALAEIKAKQAELVTIEETVK